MRMGRSKYTADEWLDHLTSTRKVNFKIFGKACTENCSVNKKDLNTIQVPLPVKKLMYPKKNYSILI